MICSVLNFNDFAILGKMYYLVLNVLPKNANFEKFKKNVEISTCKLHPKIIGSWTTFEFFVS